MNEQTKFAFEFARDTVRQFLTLATGIITLTITFLKSFVASVSDDVRLYVLCSWGLMLLSVFFGLISLMALTGSLGKDGRDNYRPSIRSKNITIPAAGQIISFFLGLVFVVIFGVKAM